MIKTHAASTLYATEGVSTSFLTRDVILDPTPACSVALFVSFATGLTASGIAQASIDGVRWTDLTGTSQIVSTNGNYLWVLSDLAGIKRVRLSVTISAGIADFEAIAGVG